MLPVDDVHRECQDPAMLPVDDVHRECQDPAMLPVDDVHRECQDPAMLPVDDVQIKTIWMSSISLGKSIYKKQLEEFVTF
jgi:hypothetical protein